MSAASNTEIEGATQAIMIALAEENPLSLGRERARACGAQSSRLRRPERTEGVRVKAQAAKGDWTARSDGQPSLESRSISTANHRAMLPVRSSKPKMAGRSR